MSVDKNPFSRYLLWFANDHVDFRAGELRAIISILNLNIELPDCIQEPFIILDLPSEQITFEIANRSVILRSIIELWAEASKIEDLHNKLKSYPTNIIKSYFSSEKSFKIKVETFCNSQTIQEKIDKIESFSYLPLDGSVKLKNPDTTLQYIEYFGLDPNKVSKTPCQVFFGRKLADGRRDIITELSLKSRKFIGNTSMDAQLSLIMANLAKVQPGDFIFDPFVGSGSLLISAAYFGAYVFGCDIDYLMLHGRTPPTRKQHRHIPRQNESVRANFEQYGFQSRYIDVLVADSSLPLWRENLMLDAIITDPPYGIREATEKVGGNKIPSKPMTDINAIHYPTKIDYSLPDILSDLMNFAAKHLKLSGRLVYWIPVFRQDYSPEQLPQHSCFSLVSNSEQILSTHTSRRLLTYEKFKNYNNIQEKVIQDDGISFREKFFHHAEETRQIKKKKKMENLKNYQMKLGKNQNKEEPVT